MSPTLAQCELTHLTRQPIDPARAASEHAEYELALQSLGATIVRAAPAPELPDAVFVEDTAIVLDEVAVITRPGSPRRRGETAAVAEVLREYRLLLTIREPATLDGGDVLRVGRAVFVGLSSRTSRAGVDQLATLLRPWDYRVVPVEVTGCLHLKSAVTGITDGLLLANPERIRPADFAPFDVLSVHREEPDAANALRIAGAVIFPSHYPRTTQRLEEAGIVVRPVPCGELAKAEGGVTCCSILVDSPD